MKREYGIDLVKMLSMVLIVAHHILGAGGVEQGCLERLDFIAGGLVLVFHSFCYCAVDVFVIASGYIMYRKVFRYSRVFKLWRLVVGYSLALCVLSSLFGMKIGWRDWMNSCFPILTNQYWFFTQYFALFLTIPFMNRLIEHLSNREFAVFLVTGMGILGCGDLVAGTDLFYTNIGYSYLWFMYLYVLGAALHKISHMMSWKIVAIGLIVGTAGSGLARIGGIIVPLLVGSGERIGLLAQSYASPFVVLLAVSFFLCFVKIDIRCHWIQKVVAFVAPSTFIVYVIHSNKIFFSFVHWKEIFLPMAKLDAACLIVGVAFVSFLIFGAVVIIDSLRRFVWIKLSK